MKRGFTLIEILVAMSVFSLIIVIFSGLFVSSARIQGEVLAKKQVLDSASFIEEYISRSLRQAQKELAAPGCLSSNGLNYEKTREGRGVKFINYQGICQEFYLDVSSKRLMEEKAGIVLPLTPSTIEVTQFLLGADNSWSQLDDLQPRVTIFMSFNNNSQIQTTISQRNLDIRQ